MPSRREFVSGLVVFGIGTMASSRLLTAAPTEVTTTQDLNALIREWQYLTHEILPDRFEYIVKGPWQLSPGAIPRHPGLITVGWIGYLREHQYGTYVLIEPDQFDADPGETIDVAKRLCLEQARMTSPSGRRPAARRSTSCA
jgi:hypothetical protein